MKYEATVDSVSLAMFAAGTGEQLDAVAVIPDCVEDLVALVNLVPESMAGELARFAAWRAVGGSAPPPASFNV